MADGEVGETLGSTAVSNSSRMSFSMMLTPRVVLSQAMVSQRWQASFTSLLQTLSCNTQKAVF